MDDQFDRTGPDSPTSTTPTASSFFPNSGDQLKKLGVDIYKGVWNEFYDWEPGYCVEILETVTHWQSLLASKRRVARVAKATVARLLDDAAAQEPSVPPAQRMAEGTNIVVMSVTYFQSAPSGHRHVHARTKNVSIPVITTDAFPPHPKYESCPPVSRSVLMSLMHQHTLRFIPYADDERFPAQAHQAKFETLEWETPFDPDVEMIQIETVKRLCAEPHKLDTQDIDRMKMFKEIRLSNNTGLQWDQSQRDTLHWPGGSSLENTQEGQLDHHTPDVNDLRQRLMSNLRIFCPSINCLHSVCETHGQMHTSSYIPSGKPLMTGKDMILSEGEPCGPDCYRYIQDFEKFMETLPPSPSKSHHTGSLDTLETVLGVAPDLFPCQLAIICLKPCKQVFAQRLQLFPDHMILPTNGNPSTDIEMGGRSYLQHKKKTRERLKFVDEKSHLSCELLAACAHPGPCTSNNCPCHVQKQHCSLMCKCGVNCDRQWKGCNCTNGRCLPATCDCAKQSKECIPGKCINCDAGGQTSRPCNNTKMQCLVSKPIEVKCGSYGLGAFACQNMNPNAFLGTYVGHIITNEMADQTMNLAKHTSLNYLFEVTPDREDVCLPIFDATYIGNATRFLNHSTDGKENVDARTMLVIGEHQIGFFTNKKVKAGEELFLNYGDGYWKSME